MKKLVVACALSILAAFSAGCASQNAGYAGGGAGFGGGYGPECFVGSASGFDSDGPCHYTHRFRPYDELHYTSAIPQRAAPVERTRERPTPRVITRPIGDSAPQTAQGSSSTSIPPPSVSRGASPPPPASQAPSTPPRPSPERK